MITQKLGDYVLFKMVFDLIKAKEHLTKEGLNKIVGVKRCSNTAINDKPLQEAFPNALAVARPIVVDKTVSNPFWFAGFSSAEACFFVTIRPTSHQRTGYQVSLIFTLTQHNRDEWLMKSFVTYLGCGSIEKTSRGMVNFHVRRLSDNLTKIIPFFLQYPILGVKSQDFQDWCKVAYLMKDKKHLTWAGLKEIRRIKSLMNTKRGVVIK